MLIGNQKKYAVKIGFLTAIFRGLASNMFDRRNHLAFNAGPRVKRKHLLIQNDAINQRFPSNSGKIVIELDRNEKR